MRIENGYLYLEEKAPQKIKKITGSNVSGFSGLDTWNKQGDTFLSRYNIVKNYVDPFYEKRGAIAEKLAVKYFEKLGYFCVHYDPRKSNWDLFPNNEYFGGVIDIDLYKDNLYETLVEVKGKNIKDYEKISTKGDLGQENQGTFYGYHKNLDYIYMFWFFFDDRTEFEIRNDLPITTFKNCKYVCKKVNVIRWEEENQMEKAKEFNMTCFNEKRIPISTISDKVLLQVKEMIANGNNTN